MFLFYYFVVSLCPFFFLKREKSLQVTGGPNSNASWLGRGHFLSLSRDAYMYISRTFTYWDFSLKKKERNRKEPEGMVEAMWLWKVLDVDILLHGPLRKDHERFWTKTFCIECNVLYSLRMHILSLYLHKYQVAITTVIWSP